MSDMIKITDLYDLNETIAADYLKGFEYPWEALAGIKAFILELGKTLPEDRFEKRGEDIWVAKSAKIAPTASLNGPLIIDEDAEIRHCAFIRGSVIVGKNSVVGNSTELKNVILFNTVQVRSHPMSNLIKRMSSSKARIHMRQALRNLAQCSVTVPR